MNVGLVVIVVNGQEIISTDKKYSHYLNFLNMMIMLHLLRAMMEEML